MDRLNEHPAQGAAPISVGASSDVGRVRDENQDTYGAFSAQEETEQLFIVADGMGGHERGREASTTTVKVVEEAYFSDRGGSVLDRLQFAFEQANEKVHTKAETLGDQVSMGTTATALVLAAERAYLAHVGDSRAYRFRPDESRQLTRDHTVPQKLRRNGILTAEEARTHPRHGTLTRAIGVEPTIDVDRIEVGSLRSEDHFLLCTDGLEDLSETTLRKIVLKNPPQPAAEELVHRANEQGGKDNATALVVRIGPS